MAWTGPYSTNKNPGLRQTRENQGAMFRTANQLAANKSQIAANTAAGVDRYGNALRQPTTSASAGAAPAPQSTEQKLDQTRKDIYGAWENQLGLFQSQPYAQLTGQMQQRASGANAPYSPQTIASDIGAQQDAISKQQQQQALSTNRAFDRGNVGGGLRTSALQEQRSAAGAGARRSRMDIQSRADRANFAEQAQGQRDLSDWLRQEMNLRYGATAGLTGAKGQEAAFQQTPSGGSGGPGGSKGKAKPFGPQLTYPKGGPQRAPERGAPQGLPGLGGAGLPFGKWKPKPGEWEPQPWDEGQYDPWGGSPGDYTQPPSDPYGYDFITPPAEPGAFPGGLPGLGGSGDYNKLPYDPYGTPPAQPGAYPGGLPGLGGGPQGLPGLGGGGWDQGPYDPYGTPQPTNLPPGGDFGADPAPSPMYQPGNMGPAPLQRPPAAPGSGGAWPGPYGDYGGGGGQVPSIDWFDPNAVEAEYGSGGGFEAFGDFAGELPGLWQQGMGSILDFWNS